ncbi:MAG: radical SAM protein [Clostridia bacterium]|nr:radical SAM protein [Clostridia bacterium]
MSTEPKLSTYLHSKAIKNEIPISGTFELTSRCNFNCEMCYVHDDCHKSDGLTTEQWLKVAEDAKEAGTLFLLLTGGEPLIREDFAYLYTELKKMGFMISINTNGSLLHKYFDLFRQYPPSRVNISLYGSDEETYKKLCKINAFSKVIENIKELVKIGVSVKLNTVFTDKNNHQYKEIIDIAEKLGVPISTTAYAYPQVRLDKAFGENLGRMTAVEAAECTVNCEKYRFRNYDFSERAKMLLNGQGTEKCDRVSCRAGRAAYWITSDGKMQACGMLPKIKLDIFELGFQKAWQELVAEVKDIRLPKKCIECKFTKNCNACAAMCYAETGYFDQVPEYICKVSENICRLLERELKE